MEWIDIKQFGNPESSRDYLVTIYNSFDDETYVDCCYFHADTGTWHTNDKQVETVIAYIDMILMPYRTDVALIEAVDSLMKLRQSNPDTEILIEHPGNSIRLNISNCHFYIGMKGELVIDDE